MSYRTNYLPPIPVSRAWACRCAIVVQTTHTEESINWSYFVSFNHSKWSKGEGTLFKQAFRSSEKCLLLDQARVDQTGGGVDQRIFYLEDERWYFLSQYGKNANIIMELYSLRLKQAGTAYQAMIKSAHVALWGQEPLYTYFEL